MMMMKSFPSPCSKSLSAAADLRPMTEAAIDGWCQKLQKNDVNVKMYRCSESVSQCINALFQTIKASTHGVWTL